MKGNIFFEYMVSIFSKLSYWLWDSNFSQTEKHQLPKLDLLDFYTTKLWKWKSNRMNFAFQLLAEKDKDIHAWNPNPLCLHTALDKSTASQPEEAKQGI